MEVAIGAITSILGGTPLAAAAGGTAASASGLSGLATALSVLGTIGSGVSAFAQSNAMANQVELQSGQEQLQSQQRQTEQKRALMQVLGENDVTFAAAGIDLTGGIAAGARAKATKDATSQISIERQDSDFRATLAKLRAKGYRQQGAGQIGGALLGALGTGVNYKIDLQQQG